MSPDILDELFRPIINSERYRLATVLELSLLDADQRLKLQRRANASVVPLLKQREFSNLREVGAVLCARAHDATAQQQADFLWFLEQVAGDAICACIVSALPVDALAAHLAQANWVRAPDGQRYLLRYYTEPCLRTLHSRKDLPDVAEWFAPIHRWWTPYPGTCGKSWGYFIGDDTAATRTLNGLQLDRACWEALAGDPLEHRLADELKRPLEGRCHVTRLSLTRKYLAAARQDGFVEQADLITYVTALALFGEEIKRSPDWQAATQKALQHRRPLAEYFQARLQGLRR